MRDRRGRRDHGYKRETETERIESLAYGTVHDSIVYVRRKARTRDQWRMWKKPYTKNLVRPFHRSSSRIETPAQRKDRLRL